MLPNEDIILYKHCVCIIPKLLSKPLMVKHSLIIPAKVILTRILAWFAVRGLPSVQTVKSCRSSGIPLCKRVGSPSFRRWGSMQWGNCSRSPAFSSTVSVAMSPELGDTGYFLVSKYLERQSTLLLYSTVRFWKAKTIIKTSKCLIKIIKKKKILVHHQVSYMPKNSGQSSILKSHFQGHIFSSFISLVYASLFAKTEDD